MKDLQTLTITIDRRQEIKGAALVRSDLRIWIRGEAKTKEINRKDYIMFLCIGNEALDLFEGRKDHAMDLLHQVRTFGELWTFYDFEAPRGESGLAVVPYRNVIIPGPVRAMIANAIKDGIKAYDAQPDETKEEIRLDFSADLDQWGTYYGQGFGTVAIRSNQADIETSLDAERGSESFDRCWDRLSQIAKNTTHTLDDVGIVEISVEDAGQSFLWCAGNLAGGLINHAKPGESPEWSLHT